MTEKEKLLSDLDGLTYDDWHMFHSDTEVQGIATDAFKYIQEQPEWISAKKPRPIAYSTNPYTGLPLAHCPKCLRPIRMFFPGAEEETHFCPRCGQELMWDGQS